MKHMLGVFGSKGEGFVQMLGLQDRIFARFLTFENGLGCQAVILGSVNWGLFSEFCPKFRIIPQTFLRSCRDFDWISTFRRTIQV
jgi:hypothetical protein